MQKLLAFFLCLLPGLVLAQGRVTGVVQDSATHQPLAFASVFLANTTLGATTTEQGEFVFPKVPAGTYEIVGSYVGYNLSKQSITVAKGAAPQAVTLLLSSSGPALGEVMVQASAHSQEDYDKFTGLFLGQTAFSQQSRITNPKDVVVFVNDSTKELVASAKNFVEVENMALGYRLKYYGMSFHASPDGQTNSYDGQTVFEEMTPQDEQQRQQWAANRATAYVGSFMHFLRSVYTNTLRANGFLVQQVRMEPDGTAIVYPGSRPIDSVRRVSANKMHVFLRFTGDIQVAHFGESPDPAYNQPMSPLGYSRTPYPAVREVSKVRLLVPEVEILPSGALRNSGDVPLGEYWSFESVGELLPLDYEPPTTLPASAPTPAPAPTRPQPAAGRAQMR